MKDSRSNLKQVQDHCINLRIVVSGCEGDELLVAVHAKAAKQAQKGETLIKLLENVVANRDTMDAGLAHSCMKSWDTFQAEVTPILTLAERQGILRPTKKAKRTSNKDA